jgi:hypothetical protein
VLRALRLLRLLRLLRSLLRGRSSRHPATPGDVRTRYGIRASHVRASSSRTLLQHPSVRAQTAGGGQDGRRKMRRTTHTSSYDSSAVLRVYAVVRGRAPRLTPA